MRSTSASSFPSRTSSNARSAPAVRADSFFIWACAALPDAVKQRLAKKRDQRITESGEIIIQAQRFRSQEQNREDARQRLAALVRSVLEPPKPRMATKPTRASQRRRLENKRAHGTLKQQRQTPGASED